MTRNHCKDPLPTPLAKLAAVVVVGLLAGGAIVPAAAQTNEDMESAIRGTLVEKLGQDASTIRVAFYDGRAVLSGKVAERSTEELAQEVALFVRGVSKVQNHVVASNDPSFGAGKIDAEAQDSSIESNVKTALRHDVGKTAGEIEVEAADGCVSLRGTVPDQLRYQVAMNAATKTAGVKKVIDLLTVGN